MPRLSLYRPNRTRDYQFLDRTISEMYTVGGVDLYVHKYMGPQTGGEDSAFSGNFDATQPVYEDQSVLNIQDLLLLENRDRIYDPDVYVMRGVFNMQDIDFDLTQFGLFLNADTLFITFHYNDMIDTYQRKIMTGDVIEVPTLKDYNPLDPAVLPYPKYYVVQDAAFAAEGFSQTWLPHLWRIKATPLADAQEYRNILDKPFVSEYIWDPGDYFPAGSVVNYGDVYYRATQNVPAGVDINNTQYWSLFTPPTISDVQGTRTKDTEINDAILAQAEIEVPTSGYDVVNFYVEPTTVDGRPAAPVGLGSDSGVTVDGTEPGMAVTPRADGYTAGYLTGDGIPPNGFPASAGITFPANPSAGDYALRLDYFPNRLFRFDGRRWIKIEEKVRTNLSNGPSNNTLRSSFVNNPYTVRTKDLGEVPSRQSLSEALRPRADNGDDDGNKPARPRPGTQPGQPNQG